MKKYAENGLPFCEPNIKSSPFNVYALPKLDKKINFSDFFHLQQEIHFLGNLQNF